MFEVIAAVFYCYSGNVYQVACDLQCPRQCNACASVTMNGLACVARRTILVVWVDEGGLGFSCSEDARDWCQWAMLGAVLNLGHVDWLVLTVSKSGLGPKKLEPIHHQVSLDKPSDLRQMLSVM